MYIIAFFINERAFYDRCFRKNISSIFRRFDKKSFLQSKIKFYPKFSSKVIQEIDTNTMYKTQKNDETESKNEEINPHNVEGD